MLFEGNISADGTDHSRTMRVLRDVYLTKDDGPNICGWHVDDMLFWPVLAKFGGVNAWVALDDMPAAGGGGFALAVGSHVVDWRHHDSWPTFGDAPDVAPDLSNEEWIRRAHYAIGASTYFPSEGFHNATHMLLRRPSFRTCEMETVAPLLYAEMERRMRVYDLKAGDVVFHDRWLFHRTVPMVQQAAVPTKIYRRYSIRYNAGEAILPRGYSMEWSLLCNASWAGMSANAIVNEGGPWYPQAWPNADKKLSMEEMERFRQHVRDAQGAYGERLQELREAIMASGASL